MGGSVGSVAKSIVPVAVGIAASFIPGPGWAVSIYMAAAALGSSLVMNAVFPSDIPGIEGFEFSGFNASNTPRMIRQAATTWKLIYGRARTKGAALTFLDVSDGNIWLYGLVTCAGHEVDGFESVWFDADQLTYTASNGAVISPSRYVGYAWVWTGDGTEAGDADLLAQMMADSPDLWTADHKQLGHAKIYFKLKYNRNVWSAIPQVSAIIRGKKVYDPRSGLTAWADNVALCVADYCISALGLKEPTGEMDWSGTITAAANICDEDVALKAGGTEKRYTCNGVLDTKDKTKANLSTLLTSMAGNTLRVNGLRKIYAGAYRAPTTTLDIDELAEPIKGLQCRTGRRDLCNAVKGTYVSENNDWQDTDFPMVSNASYLAEDNGERLWKDIRLPMTGTATMAQRLAKIELERNRRQVRFTWPGMLSCYRLEPCQTVAVDMSRYGWSAKVFEVMEANLRVRGSEDAPALGCDLLHKETDANVYSWSAEERGHGLQRLVHPAQPLQRGRAH